MAKELEAKKVIEANIPLGQGQSYTVALVACLLQPKTVTVHCSAALEKQYESVCETIDSPLLVNSAIADYVIMQENRKYPVPVSSFDFEKTSQTMDRLFRAKKRKAKHE